MIRLVKQNKQLLLIYQSDRYNDARWIDEKLKNDRSVTLRRTFTFTLAELVIQPSGTDEGDDTERIFLLGVLDGYSEKDWQTKILGLILFVFPKYVAVLENVHIKDFYTNAIKATDRYIDLMLVDANGSIDIIEVKKPFSNALVSRNTYRDNHTPRKELAGSVMQAEKYLFHLNKWGYAGEQKIYNKRKDELPSGIDLKITNPKALILLGRDNDFEGRQRFDFEIIRRKYANMLDIMTYDDLLRRVANIIEMMKRQSSQGNKQ